MRGWFNRHLSKDPVGQRRPILVYVMVSRLALMGLLLVVLSVLLPRGTAAAQGFFVFIGLAFLVTIPYAVWLRDEATAEASMPYQFLVDVLVITGLVHFTGGVRSELTILYPLVILVAGFVVSGRLVLHVALLSVLFYAALVLAEMQEALPYLGPTPWPYADRARVIRELMMRVVIFSFFTAAAAFIGEQYFNQSRQLRRLRGLGQVIFDTVGAPMLGVVPGNGRVVLANLAAAKLFGLTSRELLDHHLGGLLDGEQPTPERLIGSEVLWRAIRPDGTRIPCLIEGRTSLLPLPAEAGLGMLGGSGEAELLLLVFHDMSALLRAEQQERERDNLRAAASMLAEVAHEVRNPLTAIRGAGELLAQAAGAVAQQRRAVSAADWNLITSMCETISEETSRLDAKVQDFLHAAAQDPERLRQLTDQAREWLDKLPLFATAFRKADHGQDSHR